MLGGVVVGLDELVVLQGLVEDARDKGAEVIEVNPGGEDFSSANQRKMPLNILKNVTDEMKVMQEEIFGPVLPVMTYNSVDQAVDYVNEHDRPLGLYYWGTRWSVGAWCELREDYRNFRPDRMGALTLLEESWSPTDGINLEAFLEVMKARDGR